MNDKSSPFFLVLCPLPLPPPLLFIFPDPGTFKFQKVDLRKEGFSPVVVKDRLYFLDPRRCQYLPLTEEVFQRIQTGQEKL